MNMVSKARPAGPVNTSRGAGAVAPTSTAATEPGLGAHVDGQAPGGFYTGADNPPAPASDSAPSALAMVRFAEATRTEGAALEDGLSADAEAAGAASVEENQGEETLEQAIARIGAIRRPLGAFSQKLALASRPGYHRHWFNDHAGRIEEATANGWSHVLGTDKTPIKRCVGSGRDRGALYAFAMEIPLVFWQADQDARHRAATDKIESIKAQPFRAQPGSAKPSDKGKFYSPEEAEAPLSIQKGA